MLARPAILLATFTTLAQLVAAGTPGCLIGAINTSKNPADVGSVCSSSASTVQSQTKKLCGDHADDAMKSFASICSAAGKPIASASASDSSSASQTDSSSDSASVTKTSGSSKITTTPVSTKAASTVVFTSAGTVLTSTVPATTAFATAAATNSESSSPSVTGVSASTGAAPLPTAHAGSLAALLIGAGIALAL